LQAEKKVKELQVELDDLSQRLDEAGGATQAQVRRILVTGEMIILESPITLSGI